MNRTTTKRPRGVAGVYPPAFVERTAPPATTSVAQASVAGVYPPAFVERGRIGPFLGPVPRVAGVYPPAFVERGRPRSPTPARTAPVSPEFTLRPSLSAPPAPPVNPPGGRCRRSYPPAFVERKILCRVCYSPARGVAGVPAPRPSLSGSIPACTGKPLRLVSPEYTLRHSLSEHGYDDFHRLHAAIRRSLYAPAFVEQVWRRKSVKVWKVGQYAGIRIYEPGMRGVSGPKGRAPTGGARKMVLPVSPGSRG